MMFVVSASPNTKVPISIAVIGSNTPSTDAFVAPMFLVALWKNYKKNPFLPDLYPMALVQNRQENKLSVLTDWIIDKIFLIWKIGYLQTGSFRV